MKTNSDLDHSSIADLDPAALLKSYASFKDYQLLGKCLDYNPKITAAGNTTELNNWNYDDLDQEGKKGLDRWITLKDAAPEFNRQLLNAATAIWSSALNYKQVLKEIADHLGVEILTSDSLADNEQKIIHKLLEKALAKIESLPEVKKAQFNEEIGNLLRKQGVELGSQSAFDYLKAGGLAGAGALVGTQIVAGIILAHLSIYTTALFTLGLWAVPTMSIFGIIFAPLMGGALVYYLGKHNFRKTIPCVAFIAALRQTALLPKPIES